MDSRLATDFSADGTFVVPSLGFLSTVLFCPNFPPANSKTDTKVSSSLGLKLPGFMNSISCNLH